MKEIPSAEEFYIQEMKEFYNKLDSRFPEELVKMAAPIAAKRYIEFAKLHVEAALKAAARNAHVFGKWGKESVCLKGVAVRDEDGDFINVEIDKTSILTAYPETNIK